MPAPRASTLLEVALPVEVLLVRVLELVVREAILLLVLEQGRWLMPDLERALAGKPGER